MSRGWWKAYFFLALALTGGGLALPLFVDEGHAQAWWEWLYVPLYAVQIVGLFGFVYWRRLAIPPLWQFVFVASVIYEAWDLFSIATDPELKGNSYADLVFASVGVALLLHVPMLIALFLYGFRCKELWLGAT